MRQHTAAGAGNKFTEIQNGDDVSGEHHHHRKKCIETGHTKAIHGQKDRYQDLQGGDGPDDPTGIPRQQRRLSELGIKGGQIKNLTRSSIYKQKNKKETGRFR